MVTLPAPSFHSACRSHAGGLMHQEQRSQSCSTEEALKGGYKCYDAEEPDFPPSHNSSLFSTVHPSRNSSSKPPHFLDGILTTSFWGTASVASRARRSKNAVPSNQVHPGSGRHHDSGPVRPQCKGGNHSERPLQLYSFGPGHACGCLH